MVKKRKGPPLAEEGPPDVSTADLQEVLGGKKRAVAAPTAKQQQPQQHQAARKPQAKPVAASAPAAATMVASKAAVSMAPSLAVQSPVEAATLALELLETATKQTVQRMGWFRDVRLRRAADAFMRSSRLYQQASTRLDSESSKNFETPSFQKTEAYVEELKQHVLQLQAKLKVVPMNERRDINISTASRGKVIGAETLERMKKIKERSEQLRKNPLSVIKAPALQKKRRGLARQRLAAARGAGDKDAAGTAGNDA